MSTVYTEFLNQLLTSEIDLISDDIRAMLLTEYYEPEASHRFMDISPFEISSTNYTPGGNSLYITMEKNSQVQSAKVRWVEITAKVKYIVIYKKADNSIPILCQDLGGIRNLQKNNFAIEWDDFLLELSQGKDSERIEGSGVLGSAILGKMTLGRGIVEG